MNPAVRSFLRSLVFTVLPVLFVFATDAAWLAAVGIPTEAAALVAALVGAIARAYFPNVFGERGR